MSITRIFGIIGGLGLLIGAIETGSVFWGIVVGVIGVGIGIYIVAFGGVIMGFIVGVILRIIRYIFYNIYTLLAVIIITLGVIFAPAISDFADSLSSPTTTSQSYSAPSSNTRTYYCTANEYLTVRSEPYGDAAEIGKITRGKSVQVYEISDGWARINYNNTEGYVRANFISTSRP